MKSTWADIDVEEISKLSTDIDLIFLNFTMTSIVDVIREMVRMTMYCVHPYATAQICYLLLRGALKINDRDYRCLCREKIKYGYWDECKYGSKKSESTRSIAIYRRYWLWENKLTRRTRRFKPAWTFWL